jgi:hypothetical protein
MSGLCLVAAKAMHTALSSSLRLILTFRHQLLDTIKCKTNPDLRNFEVCKIASYNQGNAVVELVTG